MARVIEKTDAAAGTLAAQESCLLTPEEVAERLRVSRPTVYAWLKMGRLPGLRAGKVWRIRPADLDAFLQPAPGATSKYSREEILQFLEEDQPDEEMRVEATDGVQKAIRLIQGWSTAEQGSDEESWEDLKAALNAGRTSGRKLFPE
jgi:excisionase family DNA binding protein